jgi:UDP-N-acetylmuramoyl-tripeptide--D-alanyl-D-alanine ligase
MNRPLRWVAQQLGIVLESDAQVTGWSVDSRTIRAGELFFALRGPRNDGHEYVAEVLAKGAAGVVVDRDIAAGGPVLRVDDSLVALQHLASAARREWGGDVVAVTGSAGKTTVKEAIAAMLSEGISGGMSGRMTVTKAAGNLNNHVGLPLSLLRAEEDAKIAVLEMGMNHTGEIRDLTAIARPQVGVVTNVGWAHIENFGSIDGIAAAKRELVESLGTSGTAVLNADDERVREFARVHPGRSVLYGQSANADVRAERVEYLAEGVKFSVDGVNFESPLNGRHGVSNLLAGIAVAGLYGIPPAKLTTAAARIEPQKMRGERFHSGGVLVYDDCYNSNPDAARAMLEVLRDSPAQRRIAVLGEMLELGHWAEPLHRDVGDYAVKCGVNVLVGIRGASCYTLDAAKRSGLRGDAAFFFETPTEAGQLVGRLARSGDAILFKGSRGVHVEEALAAFVSSQASPQKGGAA